jgi:allantoinase
MVCDLIIKSNRIMTPSGFIRGAVYIADGKIVATEHDSKLMDSRLTIDAGNDVVMPGIIDPHVHINEPGRTEWEGFDTATRAAAAGGITTVIDMPLNSTPVTTNFTNLQIKIEAVKNNAHVNIGFYGGVVPGNLYQLEKLLQGGVFGLKAFLCHSGIDDFPNVQPSELHDVLLLLKKYNRPLLVHCELATDHEGLQKLHSNPTSYEAYLQSRPHEWEDNAIAAMIKLCRATEAHIHIVHLSSANALNYIKAARLEKLPLTVETAPHYLFFAAEEIADGYTLLKCAPPIREKSNNEALWKGLKNGLIDFIATDHSPAPPVLKEILSGNFETAWGGIAGLQFSLPAVWTAGQEEDITIRDICRWMCENPARFLQLEKSKGKIENGFDADIVVWNPEQEISYDHIYHRHPATPYAGLPLIGEVRHTIVNGKVVFSSNRFPELEAGKILTTI